MASSGRLTWPVPKAVQQRGHAARVVEGGVDGGPIGQRGDLLVRAPYRSASSSPDTPPGSSRAWAAARLARAVTCAYAPRLPQMLQKHGHAERVIKGGVGGRPVGQSGDLPVGTRPPKAVQQPAHVVRVVEGNVGDGPGRPAW